MKRNANIEQKYQKKYYLLIVFFLIVIPLFIFNACSENSNVDDPNHMLNLEPLKDQFNDYFSIGNIFSPSDIGSGKISNKRITHHYNFITAENDMKPDKINPNRGSYNFSTANSMVNSARASGLQVVGHTLLWHSQIPAWQRNLSTDNTSKATTLQYMKEYITRVVTEFKGRIYSWDVLNEAFPDGNYTSDWKTSMRKENPWFNKIGHEFVYEGFKAARLADQNTILYYNDYNLNMASKAKMVHDMVRDINLQWKTDSRYDGKNLIQGIGMQSHHNTGIPASQIKASLELFKPLGVIISISELDVLSQSWNEYSSNKTLTNEGKAKAASLYGEYFSLFLEYSDIIERVTFWGLTDTKSWRARAQPLPFDGKSTAKSAYFKIINALEAHKKK